jgi:hypothetical protein
MTADRTLEEVIDTASLQRVLPLRHLTITAVTAIPRSWLRAIPRLPRATISALDGLAARTVARDRHAQEVCDRIRRQIVPYDLGLIATNRIGLRAETARILTAHGYDDLDRIMRTPDLRLLALPGFGEKSLRNLRWARILCPLQSVIALQRRPITDDRDWEAAAPVAPYRSIDREQDRARA